MRSPDDSTRILRIAAWIWIGFLLAMAVTDFVLYTQAPPPLIPNVPFQPLLPALNPPLNQPPAILPPRPLFPIFLYYAVNGFVALSFLFAANWSRIQEELGRAFHPLLITVISAAPIVINILIVPRFPPGPLASAEGMALRQIPVLFVALALVAWEYQLPHVIFFSVATTALELSLIYFRNIDYRNIFIFIFIAIIRTISFIAVGVFLSTLVTRLREQQESLLHANAGLAHYASTLEQLTVSRERNRLARELHDTLAHSLTAISVTLETAKAYFDIDLNKTRDLLDKSLESTRTGVEETRRALKALRSNALEDLGLGPAIQRAAESAASRFHLDLELALPNPMPSLSPDVEQAIYRITQEAIENITNHSRAKRFSLRLVNSDKITLMIQDDGVGFNFKGREASGHFGLVGMKERAELAGGRLKIESEKGRGTKIVLTI